MSAHPHSGPFEYLFALIEGPDGGPIYRETDLSKMIAEPFNALSAALFLVIVAYFARKLRGQWLEHRLLAWSLPILAIGGIGGTIYHAFRMSRIFLYMDWVPIAVLVLLACVYFFLKVVRHWWYVPVSILAIFSTQVVFMQLVFTGYLEIPRNLAINLNYAVMALLVILPILAYLRKRGWAYARWMGYSVGCFALAWFFRLADSWDVAPSFGTHWLWHVFGAAAVFCVIELIYRLKVSEPEKPARPKAAIV